MKTILPLFLLVATFAQVSAAQTSSTSSAPSRETSGIPPRELSINAGWTIISKSPIGTDAVTGGRRDDLEVNGGGLFAVRFDVNQGNHFGHEFQYVNSRMQIEYPHENDARLGSSLNRGGYNFLGYVNGRQSKARFFGTVGVQVTDYSRPSASEIGCEDPDCTEAGQPPKTGGNNKFGFNYGAGVKVPLTGKLGLRFDIRQYINTKPFNLPFASGLLMQTEVSGGFGASF